MKKFLLLIAALALGVAACQKRSSEAKQNAKNERRVPRRFDPEQRAQERQKMAQRQADLERRFAALAA
jgi:Flp pilus assembly protein TadB